MMTEDIICLREINQHWNKINFYDNTYPIANNRLVITDLSISKLNPFKKRTLKVLYNGSYYYVESRSLFYGYYLKLYNAYSEHIRVKASNRRFEHKTNGDNFKLCKCGKATLKRKNGYLYCSNCGFDNRVYLYCRRCKQHHSIKLNNKQNLCLDCGNKWNRTINDNRVIYRLSNSIFGLKYDIKRKYKKFLIQYYDKISRFRIERLAKKEIRVNKKVNKNRSKMDDLFCQVHKWRLQTNDDFYDFLKLNINKKIKKLERIQDFDVSFLIKDLNNKIKSIDSIANKPKISLTLDDLMNLERI